jgi:hypothetical protein
MDNTTKINWQKQIEKLRVVAATFGVTKEAWVCASLDKAKLTQVGAVVHCFTLGEFNLQATETHLLITVAAEDDDNWWPSGVMVFELGGEK